jgi:hypothetical protein
MNSATTVATPVEADPTRNMAILPASGGCGSAIKTKRRLVALSSMHYPWKDETTGAAASFRARSASRNAIQVAAGLTPRWKSSCAPVWPKRLVNKRIPHRLWRNRGCSRQGSRISLRSIRACMSGWLSRGVIDQGMFWPGRWREAQDGCFVPMVVRGAAPQPRSRLAAGHRRRRRVAALTAARPARG